MPERKKDMYRKERPRCRKVLERLLKEEQCTLEELLEERSIPLSDGLRIQARKMLEEKKNKGNKLVESRNPQLIRPPVLRGDDETHLLKPYHDSMSPEVNACNVAFPSSGLVMVTSKSPRSYKKAVERIACFFQREMHFDFPQYGVFEYSRNVYLNNAKTDSNLRAFLWHNTDVGNQEENKWPIIGAACFRFKRFKDGDIWVFDWVWIHPYERRRGKLKMAWPFFKSMFGDFDFTPPFSPSMANFVHKMQM